MWTSPKRRKIRKVSATNEEYIRRRLSKKKKSLLSIISGNFELSMKGIKNLKMEISALGKCLEYIENILEKKVENVEKGKEGLGEKNTGNI